MNAPDRRSAPPAHLLAAAQAALVSMADEFGPLLQQDLQRLASARAEWRRSGDAHGLKAATHDLRGLGALYGAPLAGRIATSLERLLSGDRPSGRLVEAHVDAILAMVREGAADAAHPQGVKLAAALEAATARLAGARLSQAA